MLLTLHLRNMLYLLLLMIKQSGGLIDLDLGLQQNAILVCQCRKFVIFPLDSHPKDQKYSKLLHLFTSSTKINACG